MSFSLLRRKPAPSAAMQTFSAFSPLNGGTPDTFYRDNEYPYDLNAALDYVRPAMGVSIFPFPVVIGYVSGFAAQQNSLEYSTMYGKQPMGPWVGQFPDSGPGLSMVFPDVQGGLQKVRG